MQAEATIKRKGRPRVNRPGAVNVTTTVSPELLAEAKIAAAYGNTSISAMLRDGLELMVKKLRDERNGGKPFLPIQPPQE
jgi:hypothetical protein